MDDLKEISLADVQVNDLLFRDGSGARLCGELVEVTCVDGTDVWMKHFDGYETKRSDLAVGTYYLLRRV